MSAEATDPRLYCVIPAGGAGTRLWPLSRSGRPKFLHDLTGSGRSLLQSTYGVLGLEPGMFDFVESDVAPWWQETFWVELAAIVVLTALTALAFRSRRRA